MTTGRGWKKPAVAEEGVCVDMLALSDVFRSSKAEKSWKSHGVLLKIK